MEKHPPFSLQAKTKQELRLQMLAVNKKYGKKFHFFDFSYAQGMWHCWFELSERERFAVEQAEGSNE